MSEKTTTWATSLLTELLTTSDAMSGSLGSSLYVALLKSTGTTAAGSMTNELNTTDNPQYTRVAVARTGSDWSVTGGVGSNDNAITWAQQTSGSSTTVTFAAVCKGSTIATDDALYFTPLTTNRTLSTGVTLEIEAGDLTITES